MPNPIIAEVTRGPIVESRHRGAFVVTNHRGAVISSAGDFTSAFFPRSAIKAFQCLPLIESGAAAQFGLNDEEIALCCSSHSGEPTHVRVARSILAKAGVAEACYECGASNPIASEATFQLVRHGEKPQQVHNPCSGKHAGMLALAKFLNVPLEGYSQINHPVQRAVAACLSRYCDLDVSNAPHAIDGCSLPAWALPMQNVALGFARLGAVQEDSPRRIINSARQHPFMIAGTGQFDTKIMQAVPRLFIKFGAEGVFCGAIPHSGLGFALKCDDGAKRGAEVAAAHMLANLNVWTPEELGVISAMSQGNICNARKIDVGEIRATQPSQIRVTE